MAICCPAVVVLSCDWNACLGYPLQDVLIAGEYVFTVNSPTPQTLTYFFGIDETIVILPQLLNDAATHTITITDPDGNLLNDTCYQITTKIHFTPCLI